MQCMPAMKVARCSCGHVLGAPLTSEMERTSGSCAVNRLWRSFCSSRVLRRSTFHAVHRSALGGVGRCSPFSHGAWVHDVYPSLALLCSVIMEGGPLGEAAWIHPWGVPWTLRTYALGLIDLGLGNYPRTECIALRTYTI